MTLSVQHIALIAKQQEIEDLRRLQSRTDLVITAGRLIHALQAERGASSIYIASEGKQFQGKRHQLLVEAQAIENQLRQSIETELNHASITSTRIVSLIAWIILGLDALFDLRKRITDKCLSGEQSIAAFTRLISGLISLIFEVADTAVDPQVSRHLVALFNLVQGKEFAGQERALGSLAFGSGQCSKQYQQKLRHAIEAQESNFKVFQEFSDEAVTAKWLAIQNMPVMTELSRLRYMLSSADENTKLNTELSSGWFEICSERMTLIWEIECMLVDALQQECESLIAKAETDLLDSKGLLKALQDRQPLQSDILQAFFNPDLPVEQSLGFIPSAPDGSSQARSVIEILQAQSQRLAQTESELSSARRALEERKTIERAKGILMAKMGVSEDEAYKKMRSTAMDQNRRLIEIAESVLSFTTLT